MKPLILISDDSVYLRVIRVENYLEIDSQMHSSDRLIVKYRDVKDGDTDDHENSKHLYEEFFVIDHKDDDKYIPADENFDQASLYISVDVAFEVGLLIADEVAKCLSTENNVLNLRILRKQIKEFIRVKRMELLKAYANGELKYDFS